MAKTAVAINPPKRAPQFDRAQMITTAFDILMKRPRAAQFSRQLAYEALSFVWRECGRLLLEYSDYVDQEDDYEIERMARKKERMMRYRATRKEERRLELLYASGELPRPPSAAEKIEAAFADYKTAVKSEVYEEIFDAVKIRGKSIGGIWFHELQDYRRLGAFEACICSLLLEHGTPADDCTVRDFVTASTLAGMVDEARKASITQAKPRGIPSFHPPRKQAA